MSVGERMIHELADNHGSIDLLTAYLMRNFKMTYEQAEEIVYDIDFGLERAMENRLESGRRYVCKYCGEEFWFNEDDFYEDGSFRPDGEEMLWEHIRIEHPDVFNDVCELETPFMLEECYEEEY